MNRAELTEARAERDEALKRGDAIRDWWAEHNKLNAAERDQARAELSSLKADLRGEVGRLRDEAAACRDEATRRKTKAMGSAALAEGTEIDKRADRLEALTKPCPDAPICQSCPASTEDDVCLPGERREAEALETKPEPIHGTGETKHERSPMVRAKLAAEEGTDHASQEPGLQPGVGSSAGIDEAASVRVPVVEFPAPADGCSLEGEDGQSSSSAASSAPQEPDHITLTLTPGEAEHIRTLLAPHNLGVTNGIRDRLAAALDAPQEPEGLVIDAEELDDAAEAIKRLRAALQASTQPEGGDEQ